MPPQRRIFALEEEVFQASLAAVKQEALVSTLRRKLEPRGTRGAPPSQQQAAAPLLAARRTAHAAASSSPSTAAAAPAATRATLRPGQGGATPPGRGTSQGSNRLRHNEFLATEASASTPPLASCPRPSLDYNAAASAAGPVVVSPGRSPCCCCGGATMAETTTPSTPAARTSIRDGRRSGSDDSCVLFGSGGGGGGVNNTAGRELDGHNQQHPRSSSCDGRRQHPRTPTTDILRRLLYEKTPPMSSSLPAAAAAAASGAEKDAGGTYGSWCAAAEDGSDPNARRRSRRGRRLFAEGSAALRARPADDSDDVAAACRGPGALFPDSVCGSAGAGEAVEGDRGWEARSCGAKTAAGAGVVAEEEGSDCDGRENPPGGRCLDEATGAAGEDSWLADQAAGGGPATGEEGVLRERLLQARREFSALRSGAPPVDF